MVEATLGDGRGLTPFGRADLGRLIALLLPLGLLGGAMGSQYIGGLAPCEMCYWQRWPHGAAIVLAGLSFSASALSERSKYLTLAASLAIAVSGAIGVYHAGVEVGLFQGFTSCTSAVRGANTQELLEQLMKVPLVRCDQIQWAFLGVSMAGWNAILSIGGAAAIAWLTLAGKRRI